jgi:ribose transport system permease protein
LILVLFAALCLFVFNYTKIGRRQKFLGGNPICAKMTGISNNVYGIIAFAIAGIGVGLGAFMTIVYTPTVSTTTAGSIGMSVFIAIVFGGMPISGGSRSKIYAAIVGGFSYMILKNILFILFSSVGQARDGYVQIISAVLFLVVVYAASVNYRSKNLPR